MNDEYLWDKSGDPDAEVARLEEALSPLRYRDAQRTRAIPVRLYWWAAAAAVIVIAVASWLTLQPSANRHPAWQIAATEGSPRIAGKPLQASGGIYKGQLLETDAVSRATLQSEFVGEIHVEPNSQLQVVSATAEEQKLSLRHGTIRALIWAPPQRFVVDTPSARTIDLGCAYTLQVAPGGDGLLTVQQGWVAFQADKIESFIPAGAGCKTRAKKGPGTPYFLDSNQEMQKALAQFDENADNAALSHVLSLARPQDALTIWHLLSRASPENRGAVYDRLAHLVSLPSTVTREGIQRRDPKMLDLAWDALGLGETDWWRQWKRQW